MTPEKPKVEWTAIQISNKVVHDKMSITKRFLDSDFAVKKEEIEKAINKVYSEESTWNLGTMISKKELLSKLGIKPKGGK